MRYALTVQTIAQRELRNDNAKIMRRVEAGETFVVTRNGHPIAEIRPVPAGRQRFVSKDRLVALSERSEPIDRHRFRKDLDALADPWFEA